MEEKLDIENKVIKRAFIMSNYMHLYNVATEMAMSVLIPEEKRHGEGELQPKDTVPKSP